MADSILSILGHLYLMMRELECCLFIWSLTLVEWQGYSAGLKIDEVQRICPRCHFILQSVGVKIDSILKVRTEVPQDILISCCHANL